LTKVLISLSLTANRKYDAAFNFLSKDQFNALKNRFFNFKFDITSGKSRTAYQYDTFFDKLTNKNAKVYENREPLLVLLPPQVPKLPKLFENRQ
jgi:hypothetical protein